MFTYLHFLLNSYENNMVLTKNLISLSVGPILTEIWYKEKLGNFSLDLLRPTIMVFKLQRQPRVTPRLLKNVIANNVIREC